MKLTLTQYSTDGLFTDRRVAEVGVNCPYAIKIQVKRWCFTLYRWSCLTVCLSKANSDQPRGGDRENWAEWVWWQDNPWGSFQFWSARRPTQRRRTT